MYHFNDDERNLKVALEDFHSGRWEVFQGAYGNIQKDVENMMNFDEIGLENVFESLYHQMSFYSGIYLAMPYLTVLLEQAMEQDDFEMERNLISNMGICLATDNSINQYNEKETIEKEILDNYLKSIQKLQGITKHFLNHHIEKIKQLDNNNRSMLATAVLAIFGDHETAWILTLNCWDSCYMCCDSCDYFDEDKELSIVLLWHLSVSGMWCRKNSNRVC